MQPLHITERLYKPKWHIASCSWYAKLDTLHMKENYLLANLSFVCGAESHGETSPSFSTVNGRLMLLACGWKLPLQLITCKGDTNRSSLTMANKYLFVDLLFFESKEGNKATLPSFSGENWSIDAPNSSLEAPTTTHHKGGCKPE